MTQRTSYKHYLRAIGRKPLPTNLRCAERADLELGIVGSRRAVIDNRKR